MAPWAVGRELETTENADGADEKLGAGCLVYVFKHVMAVTASAALRDNTGEAPGYRLGVGGDSSFRPALRLTVLRDVHLPLETDPERKRNGFFSLFPSYYFLRLELLAM